MPGADQHPRETADALAAETAATADALAAETALTADVLEAARVVLAEAAEKELRRIRAEARFLYVVAILVAVVAVAIR